MRADGRKFVMAFYGMTLHEVTMRLHALAETIARNIGEENVKLDRLHREVLTPKVCIRCVSWEEYRNNRLRGLRADECFGFGDSRNHYVTKAAIEKGPYKGTIIDYILEMEGLSNDQLKH